VPAKLIEERIKDFAERRNQIAVDTATFLF